MARFDSAIALATKLILKNGQAVLWRSIPAAAIPDPLQPWKPSAAVPVDRPVTICFLPYSRVNFELMRTLGLSEIQTGTLYGLMAAVDFVPSPKDVVIRNGQEYRIKGVDTLSPNDQKILYTIDFAL